MGTETPFDLSEDELTQVSRVLSARTGWHWQPVTTDRTWAAAPRPGVRAVVLPPVPGVDCWKVGLRVADRTAVRDLRPSGMPLLAVADAAGSIVLGMVAELEGGV